MNFITTSGNQFRDGANRFRFLGVNDWDLGKKTVTLANIQTELNYMQTDHISVVRISVAGNQGSTPSIGNYRYLDNTNTLQWNETQLDRKSVV